MRKKLLVIAVAIIIVTGLLMVSTGSIYKWKKLPATLDQYYSTQPSEYLMRMFELAEPMQGIIM